MIVKRVVVGDLATNCYLLIYEGQCIIIDPGDEADKIINEVGKLTVKTILITHYHFDHIGALEKLKNFYNVSVNDFSSVDNMEVINTHGHTNDSLTFYFPNEKVMFCGDFLFKNSFGRTDLGGNDKQMVESLERISSYPDDTILYPGHGDITTIGKEKTNFADYINYLNRI